MSGTSFEYGDGSNMEEGKQKLNRAKKMFLIKDNLCYYIFLFHLVYML